LVDDGFPSVDMAAFSGRGMQNGARTGCRFPPRST
jgi:hypothetical protein